MVVRNKDEAKREEIIRATVKLVNEIGFASSSVAKIAEEANVSPATIYIYFKNKEELLVSTYVEIKQVMGRALLKDFDETRPLRDIFRTFWFNGVEFMSKNQDVFQYSEQFSNSPYTSLVKAQEVDKYFEPLLKILNRGKEQKIIKDVPFEVLAAFVFHPMIILSKMNAHDNFKMNKENIDRSFTLAWDAIKF